MPKSCKLFEECKKPAVYQIPHSKLALCAHHYLVNVEKRVKRLIEKKHMFHPDRDEKILIATSGGKDSQILLHIIKKLYPIGLEIHALFIELGIKEKNYSTDSKRIAKELCDKLQVPFHEINTETEFGITIDKISQLKKYFLGKNIIFESNPMKGECSYCGIIKRYTINKFAFVNNFTAVVTGHNLTDESTQLMNNFFNVNLNLMANSGPIVNSKIQKLVPRVKPLFFISEEEIIMYAYFSKIKFLETECPYSINVPNAKLKIVMKKIEKNRTGNTIGLMRRFHKIMQPTIKNAIYSEKKIDKTCKICQFPTFSNKCSFCKMLDILSERFKEADIGMN